MKGSILIVEDEADMRDLVGEVLKGTYTVSTADTGAALKQAFTGHSPTSSCSTSSCPTPTGSTCSRKSRSNGLTPKSSC